MHTMPVEPSFLLQLSFVLLTVTVIVAVSIAAKSLRLFGFALAWIALTGALAKLGWLANFSAVPPRAAMLLGSTMVLLLILARSDLGIRLSHLPVSWLIGFQSFRIVVEVLIHWAVAEGVAPIQLSWDGLNFDIVTGLSALAIAPWANRIPRWLLLIWNSLGMALVLSVVTVAVFSLPTPIQLLKPDNVWIAFVPFVWLPSVLVLAALLGHIVLFRKLLSPISNDI